MDENEHREWTPVTDTVDPATAEAIAAHLQANGIPARVVLQSGSAKVTAPAWLESEASFVAAHAGVDDVAGKGRDGARRQEQELERDAFSRLSRAMMVVAAVAFSPFAVLFALIYVVANRLRRE